jgi:hypothetical protein
MPLLVTAKNMARRILPEEKFDSTTRKAQDILFPLFDKELRTKKKYEKQFIKQYGLNVQGGPFQGMKYIQTPALSPSLLKLIGCHESVLHESINNLKTGNYDTIIDIGTAEGYYMIGLGRLLPRAALVGYDIDKKCLELVEELAEKNNCEDRIKLFEKCTPDHLAANITDDTLLFCDAEGFELEIIDPQKTPKLSNVSTMIIETHDHLFPNNKESVTKTIQSRFSSTHNIETIKYTNETYLNNPFLASAEPYDQQILINERDVNEQVFLVMHKK